jgi:hypothetical protein
MRGEEMDSASQKPGKFPRTMVGGLSVSRMIIGTNWFCGFSHTTRAKDDYILKTMDRKKIADILEVFLRSGVDTIMGQMSRQDLKDAIKEAQDRTGISIIKISTPSFTVGPKTPVDGPDMGEAEKILDAEAALGAKILMPHQCTTDSLVDRCTGEIRHMDKLCSLIRQRNMIPGLSTHMPESIIFADKTGLDVESYISIFNAMGFLMQVEVDWTANVIRNAKKPVMVIKPMAAGQLRPFQALTFVWNTLREQDMVAVGTMCPGEAAECIDLSLSILERRVSSVKLQETRSKSVFKK